jgi:hypothetical protein
MGWFTKKEPAVEEIVESVIGEIEALHTQGTTWADLRLDIEWKLEIFCAPPNDPNSNKAQASRKVLEYIDTKLETASDADKEEYVEAKKQMTSMVEEEHAKGKTYTEMATELAAAKVDMVELRATNIIEKQQKAQLLAGLQAALEYLQPLMHAE